jgi:pimeloyl-ACP methyl ester carboxylesterase
MTEIITERIIVERMLPFYFAGTAGQLYGCHHVPPQGVEVCGAVLVCGAAGPEYYASHRALRQLAVRLANVGFHVLRFDYWGTGNSAGEDEDISVRTWMADLKPAISSLLDRSQCTSVQVVGLRWGATLLSQLPHHELPEVRNMVWWNPVLDGKQMLLEWQHEQQMEDKALGLPVDKGLDFAKGLSFPKSWMKEASAMHLSLPDPKNLPLFLIGNTKYSALMSWCKTCAGLAGVTQRWVDDPNIWAQAPLEAIVPTHGLQDIVKWLREAK